MCQCKTAVITTTKDVPMQVDGEPCMMKPCKIKIALGDNSSAPPAKMLIRNKTATCKDDTFKKLKEGSRPLYKSLEPYSFGVLQTSMALSLLQRFILSSLINKFIILKWL